MRLWPLTMSTINPEMEVKGPEGFKQFITMMRNGFLSWQAQILSVALHPIGKGAKPRL